MATVTIPETIRLQLRKPKSWLWELSTSKSSPSIILPTIQLYDYKGKLLVETKDSGNTKRTIFQSPESSIRRSKSESVSKQLKCSKSCDFMGESAIDKGNLLESKNNGRRRHKRSKSDDLFRRKLRYNSSAESIKRAELDGYKNFITLNIPDDKIQSPNPVPENNKVNKNPKTKKNRAMHNAENIQMDENLQKIVWDDNLHNQCYTTRTSSAGTLIIPEEKNNSSRRKRHGRRHDGVHTLGTLTETKKDNSGLFYSQSDVFPFQKLFVNGENYQAAGCDPSYKLNHNYTHNDYSSSRNSNFRYNVNYRNNGTHYRNQSTDYLGKSANYYDKSDSSRDKSNSNRDKSACYYDKSPGYRDKSADYLEKVNFRNMSTNYRVKNHSNGDKSANYRDTSANYLDKSAKYRDDASFRYRSANYPEKSANNINKNMSDSNVIDNLEKSNDTGGKTNGKKKRSREKSKRKNKGHLVKEHSAAERDKQTSGVSSSSATVNPNKDANDLLNLVRRLSYSYTAPRKPTNGDGEDVQREEKTDINMGSNVSRHSTKGLGRRSQSSSSICNGSGSGSGEKKSKHPEGKICSSLPSYLDDGEKNGACNNNYDRKRVLNEDRIPPLGDSAPLHWKFSDTQIICDQGYGSERSPEEEYPPPLSSLDQEALQCHHHLEPHACYPFITPESIFLIKLTKGSRGLGLSVTGGIDSTGSWPGLIRIKRLFPHQPASSCGLLNVGDLLLEANGITLTGLTNYEALEVLRTAPNHVELKICRPPPDVLNCVSPISEVPPPPPRREPPNTLSLPSNAYASPEDECYHGEFEITLNKIQGSLGFTLRKEDDSALGHYVRALVREPALTDGRIKEGDKIIAVNDVEICPMSHEQAVQFLRQCPEIVKLRLYRDSAQTPVATLSPPETTPRTSFCRKAHLRQEAVDMLNDLAERKLVEINSETYNCSLSPTTSSPRRIRRQIFPSSSSQDYIPQGDCPDYQEQFHEGIIQQCPVPFDEDAFNSLFSMESEDGDRPNRPSSLELYNPNQTPVASRKPRFNFSLAHNAYELNNLDAEVLDAPNLTYNLCNEDIKTSDSEVQEPVSMPHIPTNSSSNFTHKNPAYQSAHPQISTEPDHPNLAKPNDGTLKRRKTAVPEEVIPRAPIKEEYEVLAIELNRGWNSRLGFSLQGAAGVTYVSAVHADSVAARDGRLKPGDRLIKVNDESIEHMSTSEIIDLLRIVRGPVCVVISRVKSNEDCQRSYAEN